MNPQDYFKNIDYFNVNVNEYDETKDFIVSRPSSLNNPKDHAVMFIMKKYIDKYISSFEVVSNCLIIWPRECKIPDNLKSMHAFWLSDNPHLDFCRFFNSHNVTNFVQLCKTIHEGDYIVSGNVKIGDETVVFPYVYMNGDITIGKNCYIASGVKIIGNVHIGDNVLIKENAVIGADGLSTDREPDGKAATMPQFGGVVIEDNVQIGANTAIARGAIDNTVIRKGCKIDNCCWISHNNYLDENVFVVGEATTFGSVTVGKNSIISGNATVRNGLSIGEEVLVGAGAVVTRPVKDGAIVSGAPAKPMVFPR